MTDTVSEQEVIEQVPEVVQEDSQNESQNDNQNDSQEQLQEEAIEQNVPLSALKKERRKRQDAESELKMYREHQLKQMQQPAALEEDEDAAYEPVTKAEFKKQLQAEKQKTMREIKEEAWISSNPERAEVINEKLANFLKKRPNLAAAIEAAPNRYAEAWEFMDKLSPKQQAALNRPTATKKETPNSPSGIPKAAAMNQSIDVMSMNETEFAAYRQSKRSRR